VVSSSPTATDATPAALSRSPQIRYSRLAISHLAFNNIQGIWTAQELTMSDLTRGSVTRLSLDKVEYNLPLRQDTFTLPAIRR